MEFLSKIPYFSNLSTIELDSIKKLVVEKSFNKSEMLVLEGEAATSLFFIVSGVAKSFKTSIDGKEQILRILRPGDSFNDVPIFDGKPSLVGIQAMGTVTVYEIRKSDLEAILRKYPLVSLNIIHVLAGRVRHLVSLIEDLSFRNVIGRVAKILLENIGDSNKPNPKLTQQEMAAMAGTAREVVGRSLKVMEDEGIIKLDRHRIIISNKKALSEMAGTTF